MGHKAWLWVPGSMAQQGCPSTEAGILLVQTGHRCTGSILVIKNERLRTDHGKFSPEEMERTKGLKQLCGSPRELTSL